MGTLSLKKALSVFVLFTIASPAFSQETLTWKDAVSQARTGHPDLLSAREQITLSRADKDIAASVFFPQVAGDAALGRSRRGSADASNSVSYGVSASQLVFDGFGTYADVQAAVKTIEADEYNYTVASSNVRVDLRTAFIQLLKAQQLIHLTERIAGRRKQSRDLIRLRYEAGREHKGSFLTAEANLAQADFEVEQAKRNVVFSQRRLSVQLGRAAFAPLEIAGDLEIPSTDPVKPDLETLAETTPLLRQLIVLKEASRWGIQLARSAFYPAVFATASLGETGERFSDTENDWFVGASLSVPIFEGGRNVAGLKRSEAAYRRAEAEERSGRNGVLFVLEDAWKAYRDALETVSVESKFLEAAREREKIAESEYSTGLITFNDWIIIEDNLVRAEKSHLDARANALVAEANWRQAKGETLENE